MQARRLRWSLGPGLGVLLLLGLGWSAVRGQDGQKQPVPPAEAQAKVVKLIQELYEDDLARAQKDVAVRARLAHTLLQEARETGDDPAGRYVLLREAQRLAAEAGDVPAALEAVEELARGFTVPAADLLAMRVRTLGIAANGPAPRATFQHVVDSALLLAEDTLAGDDFASTTALLEAADRAAIRLRNVALVASIRRRLDEVRALQKEYARWEPSVRRLAADPNDAAANHAVGFYHALVKNDWERSVPMLARGMGPAADAARLELGIAKAEAPFDAGDAWVKFAKSAEGLPRLHALLHADQLYLRAMATADATERKILEGRLARVDAELPPAYRAGEITTELRQLALPQGPVYDAAFSPDGRRVVAAAYDGSLRLFDARTGKEQRRLDGHLGKVWAVAFHPDGRHVVSGGFDGTVRLWHLASAREVGRFTGHTDYVRAVAVAPDGRHVLSGGDDRLLRLWNVETGKEVRSFPGHEHFVWSVALSGDGKRALSASLDRTVRLWDVATGAELKKLVGHRDTVLGVVFTPDGRHALSGSTDRTLILWDLESGKPVRTFTGHTGYVQHVAVSPDGRFALSAGSDHTVRLWDVNAGTELRQLEGHRAPVWSVGFSRDGRLALSAGQDDGVRLWGGLK